MITIDRFVCLSCERIYDYLDEDEPGSDMVFCAACVRQQLLERATEESRPVSEAEYEQMGMQL